MVTTYYHAKRLRVGVGATLSVYPDISSNSSTSDLNVSVESTKGPATLKRQNVQVSKLHPAIKSREVLITEITDPKTIHVQDADFKERSDHFKKLCYQYIMENKTKTPSSIVVDEMYLVFENHKMEWSRGIVKEQKKTLTVYLVDHGRFISVTANQ